MAFVTLSLAVVGARHPNAKGPTRLFEIALCAPGELVFLVREPKNKADPRAIMVVSQRGVCMGYVSAERAPLIGKFMSESRETLAVFQEQTVGGAVIRVTFDGDIPVLPPPRAKPLRTEDDSGFHPDEIYPDE